jgi:hypothetical protein
VHDATAADRRAARARVSAYYEAELAKLVGRVEEALARHRAGAIDVHEADRAIHRYSRAVRELWKFCWGAGAGSHMVWVSRVLDDWAAQAEEVDWWEQAERRRRGRP